jgi:hypothetical protein
MWRCRCLHQQDIQMRPPQPAVLPVSKTLREPSLRSLWAPSILGLRLQGLQRTRRQALSTAGFVCIHTNLNEHLMEPLRTYFTFNKAPHLFVAMNESFAKSTTQCEPGILVNSFKSRGYSVPYWRYRFPYKDLKKTKTRISGEVGLMGVYPCLYPHIDPDWLLLSAPFSAWLGKFHCSKCAVPACSWRLSTQNWRFLN